MIGIDLTRISRFKNKEEMFANKILHDEEKFCFNKSNEKTKFIATRWAIKEALFKTDNTLNEYSKINIKKSNQRYVYLNYHISTSSEDDYLIAIVKKEI